MLDMHDDAYKFIEENPSASDEEVAAHLAKSHAQGMSVRLGVAKATREMFWRNMRNEPLEDFVLRVQIWLLDKKPGRNVAESLHAVRATFGRPVTPSVLHQTYNIGWSYAKQWIDEHDVYTQALARRILQYTSQDRQKLLADEAEVAAKLRQDFVGGPEAWVHLYADLVPGGANHPNKTIARSYKDICGRGMPSETVTTALKSRQLTSVNGKYIPRDRKKKRREHKSKGRMPSSSQAVAQAPISAGSLVGVVQNRPKTTQSMVGGSQGKSWYSDKHSRNRSRESYPGWYRRKVVQLMWDRNTYERVGILREYDLSVCLSSAANWTSSYQRKGIQGVVPAPKKRTMKVPEMETLRLQNVPECPDDPAQIRRWPYEPDAHNGALEAQPPQAEVPTVNNHADVATSPKMAEPAPDEALVLQEILDVHKKHAHVFPWHLARTQILATLRSS